MVDIVGLVVGRLGFSFALSVLVHLQLPPPGFRRGLYSCAATRLSRYSVLATRYLFTQYQPIGASFRLMYTCLVSRYSSMPHGPSSRPKPDCRRPLQQPWDALGDLRQCCFEHHHIHTELAF